MSCFDFFHWKWVMSIWTEKCWNRRKIQIDVRHHHSKKSTQRIFCSNVQRKDTVLKPLQGIFIAPFWKGPKVSPFIWILPSWWLSWTYRAGLRLKFEITFVLTECRIHQGLFIAGFSDLSEVIVLLSVGLISLWYDSFWDVARGYVFMTSFRARSAVCCRYLLPSRSLLPNEIISTDHS